MKGRIPRVIFKTYPTNQGAPWEILSYDSIRMTLQQNYLAPCNISLLPAIEENMSWIVDDPHWYRISSLLAVLFTGRNRR
jgi:hypothetical protein